MSAATPGQALYAQLQRRFLESAPVPPAAWTQAWDDLDAMDERFLEDAAQAVIDAATEGALRACGYTLADVGRFLEAEAAAQDARPAPGHEEFVSEILGALLQALGADDDTAPEPGETPERRAVRIAAYLGERVDELHGLIAESEPLTVKPADDVKPAPELAAAMDALTKVAESHERVMYAAVVDIGRGDPGAARRLLDEQLDGWDEMPVWDGTETGAQYLQRARGGEPA